MWAQTLGGIEFDIRIPKRERVEREGIRGISYRQGFSFFSFSLARRRRRSQEVNSNGIQMNDSVSSDSNPDHLRKKPSGLKEETNMSKRLEHRRHPVQTFTAAGLSPSINFSPNFTMHELSDAEDGSPGDSRAQQQSSRTALGTQLELYCCSPEHDIQDRAVPRSFAKSDTCFAKDSHQRHCGNSC